MNETILVVDDEKEIADLVEIYLINEGYNVKKFYNGTEALECVKNETISLAVLDVMVPDINGFEMLRQIREEHLFPIIMLTAKVQDMDKITGLTLGADDYITKPFNPLELVARVKTQLRRYTRYNVSGAASENQEITIRGLTIDRGTHRCRLNGQDLDLTPIEFDILYYLCEHRGKAVSSEEIFEQVWKEDFLDQDNTVMAHIARLRKKMNESPRNPKYVKTVWGVGYTIE